MEIFNKTALSNRQRWNRACLYAILGSLGCIIICSVIQYYVIRSSLLYVLAAYAIGWLILETGHGVHKKFSILAVVCIICIILFSDMFSFFGMRVFMMPLQALITVLRSYLSISYSSLVGLLLKATAIGIAYNKSRVI